MQLADFLSEDIHHASDVLALAGRLVDIVEDVE